MTDLPLNAVYNDWVFYAFAMAFISLAMARWLFPVRAVTFSQLLQNNQYFSSFLKESPRLNGFHYLLSVNWVLFVSLTILTFFNRGNSVYFKDLTLLITIIILFYILKLIVLKFIFITLNIDRIGSKIYDYVVSYRHFFGAIGSFLLFTIYYSSLSSSINPSTIILFMLSISIVLFLRAFSQSGIANVKSIYYFILYLCAFEVAPFLILLKYFNWM